MAPISLDSIPSVSALYKSGALVPCPGTPRTTPNNHVNTIVSLFHGDLTALAADAIVNAANKYLAGGAGVDGVIHHKAGARELHDACRALGGCETGSVKSTGGFKLPARRILHAVGPVYNLSDPAESRALLSSCYTESLRLCVKEGLKTVAFPAISTGAYAYPSREAAEVACEAVRQFLEQDIGRFAITRVIFVTFVKKDQDAYNEMLP